MNKYNNRMLVEIQYNKSSKFKISPQKKINYTYPTNYRLNDTMRTAELCKHKISQDRLIA
jgi:hypothetical protein